MPRTSGDARPTVQRHWPVRSREHEERGVSQPPLLEPVLRALAKHALVGGLADEGDDARSDLGHEDLEAFAGAREIRGAKVTRAAGRPSGRVRQADAEREKVVLLSRLENPGREARGMQQPPEVVARIGERGACSCARPAGIDAAEDHCKAWASTSGTALGVPPCVIPYSLTSPRRYKILVMKALVGSAS